MEAYHRLAKPIHPRRCGRVSGSQAGLGLFFLPYYAAPLVRPGWALALFAYEGRRRDDDDDDGARSAVVDVRAYAQGL